MSAEESLREGNPEQALKQLQDRVRKNPADAKARVFLFQLLSVMGEWDRALTQLNVAGDLDPAALPMVQTYREALRCEVLRKDIFAGNRSPLVFGDPEEWIARMVQALQLTASGQHVEAERQRGEALEHAAAVAGEIDGQRFEWIADADSRLGPVCEAIIDGKYYWVPFSRLQAVKVEPPEDLRDCVWAPAHLTYANGGETVALLPARYPGSEKSADGALRLGRKTQWDQAGEGTYVGLGQRMFATDQGEYALLDVRQIRLDVVGGDQPDQK
jgi:type VI secretion system protein ImpE